MRQPHFYWYLWLMAFLFSCKKEVNVVTREIGSGTTSRLNHFYFLNDSIGYLCGGERYDRGILLKTQNGGRSWKADSIADKSLYALFFYDAASGITAGYDAIWCETADSARHFSKINRSIYKSINAVDFINRQSGVFSFGTGYGNGGFAVTHNGGTDWNYFYDTLHAYTATSFLTDSIVLVAGYGTVKRSIDGGRSFHAAVQNGDFYQAIDFGDKDHGGVVGYMGGISYTQDAGATWQISKNSNGPWGKQDHLLGLDFFDAEHAVAVGESGLMLRTTDGGRHWSAVKSFTDADLHDVHLFKSDFGIVAGSGGKVFMFEF